MLERFWKWAGSSPTVFAPLFGFGLGLALIPFALTGRDHAAEFYGAFVAAIVAAIAVILGASYQAHLTRRRDEYLRIDDLVTEAKSLFIWLNQCITNLDRAAYRLDAFAKQMQEGAPSLISLNYANFRVFLAPVSQEQAVAKLQALAKFPIDLGLSVSSAIANLASEHGPHNSKVLRDELPINQENFEFWAKTFRDSEALLKIAQAQIAVTMRERYGLELPFPSDIEEAARRVHSLAVR